MASDEASEMSSDAASDDANLVEIFWSAQGEGPHVGRSTVFVRFGECDLRCRWCDSPRTWRPARVCRIQSADVGPDLEIDNPVSQQTIADAIAALSPAPGAFVSLTGGEPLLQPEACRAVATRARAAGYRVHLETHGLAAAALARVAPQLDVISMDWKLASDVEPAEATADRDFTARHRAFLETATAVSGLYVKVVVTDRSTDAELDAVCDAVAEIAPGTPLILQPVTPFGAVKTRPDAARLLAVLRRCEQRVHDVRLIPQTHPIYGAR